MLLLVRLAQRRLGGLTGDVYGAIVEVGEMFALVVAVLYCRISDWASEDSRRAHRLAERGEDGSSLPVLRTFTFRSTIGTVKDEDARG